MLHRLLSTYVECICQPFISQYTSQLRRTVSLPVPDGTMTTSPLIGMLLIQILQIKLADERGISLSYACRGILSKCVF